MPLWGTTHDRGIDPLGSTHYRDMRLSKNRIHNGWRTPGPGPPVTTTRDEDAVDKHGPSVANRRWTLAKTLMRLGHAKRDN